MTGTDQRVQTMCLLAISFVAAGAAMIWLRPVLIPFVLAIFLTHCLSPIIDVLMQRLHMPRPVAIAGAAVLGLLVLVLLGTLVSASVTQMTRNADRYQTRIVELADEITEKVPLERLGVNEQEFTSTLMRLPQQGLKGLVSGTIGAVMSLLSNGLLVFIFMMFMLAGSGASGPATGIWGDIRSRIQRFILTKAFVSGLTGLLVGLTLWILKVELALVFGVLAFMFNFIPSIGSVIATLLPLPVVLLDPAMAPWAKVLAIAIPGVIQFSVGNVIEPKIMGQSLDLHPVTILLALIFFGTLWGMVGMFLATPITAVIKILFEKGEYTRPLAYLLAGRLDQMAGSMNVAPVHAD